MENPAKNRRYSVSSHTLFLTRDGKTCSLPEVNESTADEYALAFVDRERGGYAERQLEPPPHIKIMTQKELVDYEPAADTGHFRFYPKGALMKALLEEFAEQIALERLGVTKIETPVLYRNVGAVREQAQAFHESDYRLKTGDDTELLLRFAGDFGLFSMLGDARVTEDQTPLRIFEVSPSYRYEKSGTCTGLKRLRAFTMPDIHSFCSGIYQAMNEFEMIHTTYAEILDGLRIPYALGFRTTQNFYDENRDYILRLSKLIEKDALVEVLERMKHYWILKNEFQYIDSQKDTVQLSTVQLDIEDSERYGLTYKDKNGAVHPFIIVHSSVGSIERIMGAVIEERAKETQKGYQATFPYWLSPTQIRLVPFGHEYFDDCVALRASLKGVSRVDIDDRQNKDYRGKIKTSQKEWVPSYILVGNRERETGMFTLKTRGNEMMAHGGEYSPEGLRSLSSDLLRGKPFIDFYQSPMVSKQIRFRGDY